MKNAICLAANNTVGCTFLDWSLHFLTGQTEYYHINNGSWIPLVNDPLSYGQVENAHGHRKNSVSGSRATQQLISDLQQDYNSQAVYTFSVYPEQIDIICQQTNTAIDQLHCESTLDFVRQQRYQDFTQLIQHCQDSGLSVVYVYADPKVVGYFWNHRNVQRMVFSPNEAHSTEDLENENENVFFRHSKDQWQSLELTNVWDVRERMALNIRPFDTKDFWNISSPDPVTWINCQELWHNTEEVVLNLVKQLGLTADSTRLQEWLSVMRRWQKIHHKNLKFYNNLDHIVECTVKGWHFPLEQLNLQQEAIIQHCLIYQHNLNLKTWNLKQFPDNTLKLHQLLEENIHNIEKIY